MVKPKDEPSMECDLKKPKQEKNKDENQERTQVGSSIEVKLKRANHFPFEHGEKEETKACNGVEIRTKKGKQEGKIQINYFTLLQSYRAQNC